MAEMTLTDAVPKRGYFIVARDSQLPNGIKLLNVPISRQIGRLGIFHRVLKRVRRYEPSAYGVEIRQYR